MPNESGWQRPDFLFFCMMNRIKFLRICGISEGISLLVLVFIAMPLKYFFDMPVAVKMVGWVHGLLFIAYVISVFLAIRPMKWNLLSVLIALVASLIPFGTIILDRSWKRVQDQPL